jgi:hypothetical protein
VAPGGLELGLTFRAVGKCLTLTAVGAEFHTPSRRKFPAACPASCGRLGSSPSLAGSFLRRRRSWYGGGLGGDGGRETLVRRSKGELWSRVKGVGQLNFVQDDHRVLVPVDDCQVWIGIQCLCRELRMRLVRLCAGKPPLSTA